MKLTPVVGLIVHEKTVGALVVVEVKTIVCPVQIVPVGTIIVAVGAWAKSPSPDSKRAIESNFFNTS